jgi:hypothetical protein
MPRPLRAVLLPLLIAALAVVGCGGAPGDPTEPTAAGQSGTPPTADADPSEVAEVAPPADPQAPDADPKTPHADPQAPDADPTQGPPASEPPPSGLSASDLSASERPAASPVQEEVPYRVVVRTSDAATATFAEDLHAVLTDPRGWVRAGFHFVEDPDAPYVIVLAEGPEVDELCLPMETWSTYSCQNGPVVALNADRWREATPQWTGDLVAYRIMLINHEVGHLLHLHHPTVHCPAPGLPAPVMAQQSTELGACRPNPWPLQWEVDLAAERREPLAPPPEHDTSDHRPTPPPVDR